jgi:hypothetical protein
MVSLKVQFGQNLVLEVEALNEDELANVVNRAINKFYKRTVLNEVKEPF